SKSMECQTPLEQKICLHDSPPYEQIHWLCASPMIHLRQIRQQQGYSSSFSTLLLCGWFLDRPTGTVSQLGILVSSIPGFARHCGRGFSGCSSAERADCAR